MTYNKLLPYHCSSTRGIMWVTTAIPPYLGKTKHPALHTRCIHTFCTFTLQASRWLNCWATQYSNLMEYTLERHMSLLMMVHGPHQECSKWLLLPLLWVGGALSHSFNCHPVMAIYMEGHTALGAQQRVTQDLCLPYIVGRGVHFQVALNPISWLSLILW